jgi:glucose-6-phosphate isomerase
MQLPDESVEYAYHSLLIPSNEEWTPAAELRAKHFLEPGKLKALVPTLMQVRGQVVAERELQQVPLEQQPLEPGFIELPQKLLDRHRRKGEQSELGRVLALASRLKANADRIVVLGVGGSYLGARAIVDALCHACHNELSPEARLGVPRLYFAGNDFDNDCLQELLEMLQQNCVEPDKGREERWGIIVVSKSGNTLETAVAYRAFRRDAMEYYGSDSEWIRQLIVPVTGTSGNLRELFLADGFSEEDILTIPDDVGDRFAVFSPAGLLPAATAGLDVRALLLGAAAMTRRFIEEPFERNPVLQFAGVNHLMSRELGKPIRVLSVWSKKLESLGLWYDQILSESLGKQGQGATPLTTVQTRDLYSRGQQHLEGARDKLVNHLVVKQPKSPPILVGMSADRNEDDLNVFSRKGLPDLLDAAYRGTIEAYFEMARPSAEITLPLLSEHVMGQLLQMLMLATVVEGRLLGVNPYGQPGVDAHRKYTRAILKGS